MLADAAGVHTLMAASELADIGEVEIEAADIVADWQRPSHDLAARSIGVLTPAGELVGYAEVVGHERGDAAVHPDHRGHGLGTWLATWMQQTARAEGMAIVGMPVPHGSPGDQLLTELGYDVRWTSWVLELPEGATIPHRPVPAGHRVRTATEDDLPAVWTVLEDAFLEWSRRERQSLADFTAAVVQRPDFEPWQLPVVVDADDTIVAAAVVILAGETGYVDRLAVRRDRRGAGLAQALLADSFERTRAHGATRSELSTDSRTGALGLYEKVGMQVRSTWLHRAIAL